jgi:hypothetical protein
VTGISQLKAQWQREAREDERKLIADWINTKTSKEYNFYSEPYCCDLVDGLADLIRNGSYRDKP